MSRPSRPPLGLPMPLATRQLWTPPSSRRSMTASFVSLGSLPASTASTASRRRRRETPQRLRPPRNITPAQDLPHVRALDVADAEAVAGAHGAPLAGALLRALRRSHFRADVRAGVPCFFGRRPPTVRPRRWRDVSMASRACSVGFASMASRRRRRGTPQKLRCRRERAATRDGHTKHLNAGTSPATGPASRPRRGRPMHLHTVRRSTRRSSRRPMTASFVFWEPSRVDGVDGVAAPPPREQLRRRRESNINARAGSTPRTSPRRRRRRSRRRRPRRAPRRIPPTPPRWTPPSSPRANAASPLRAVDVT